MFFLQHGDVHFAEEKKLSANAKGQDLKEVTLFPRR